LRCRSLLMIFKYGDRREVLRVGGKRLVEVKFDPSDVSASHPASLTARKALFPI
jgi:hypothetical protein